MKVKIKTFNGELPEYLTHEKEYQLFLDNKTSNDILDDFYNVISINVNCCSHLNGGSWEFVDERI